MKWILNLFKKMAKKKSFWLLAVIIIIIIIYLISKSGGSKIEYVTEPVHQGNLTQTVSETGAIKAATDINLNFKGNGTLIEVNVKEGDEVKEGDVLARLDAGNLEIQVRQSQANVDIAVANLNRLLAGASFEDINVTQESVNNALINYENAKRDYEALIKKIEADIKTYEEAVKIAETSLSDTTSSVDQSIISSRDNLFTSLDSAINAADHSVDLIQVLFDDKDLEPIFSDQNAQYEVQAIFWHTLAKEGKVSDASIARDVAKASLNDADIKSAVNKTLEALDVVKNALDYTFLGLSETTPNYHYPEAQIETSKSSIKIEQNNITSSINSVNTTNQTYLNSKLGYDSSINTVTGSLETAKKNLASALANKDLQLASSQANVDNALGSYNLAKAQLELKKAPARQVDIAYYQAQVNQAQAALDLVYSNLDDYIIYAPTDGIITFVNYDEGEQIGFGITDITEAAKAVISMLGQGDFGIEVDVPESDIIKISRGDKVTITLDAYSDDIVFKGKVVFIDLAETNISGVVYYKVNIELEQTDLEVKPGMTANVDIITEEKENVIYVANRAVKEDENGQKYVEVLKFGNPDKINVETGLKGDVGIEITQGLKVGQEVIIYKKEK